MKQQNSETSNELLVEVAESDSIEAEMIQFHSSYLKKELQKLASFYNIKNRSRMTKAQLISSLMNILTTEENIERVIITSNDIELTGILGLLTNDESVSQNDLGIGMFQLSRYGYVNTKRTDRGFKFNFCEPYLNMFFDAFTNDLLAKRDRHQLILKYCVALCDLYGIVPINKIIEIFNNQNDEKTDVYEVNKVISIDEKIKSERRAGYLVSEYLLFSGEDEWQELLQTQGEKPYYVPDKHKLLKHSKSTYFELTPELLQLKKYILKAMCKDEKRVHSFIDEIDYVLRMEKDMQDIMKLFKRFDIDIKSEKQLKKLAGLILNVQYNTRLRSNRGHTPNELDSINGEPKIISSTVPISHVKIGRNEPCPCGSGKKYKKCCGR